MQEKQESRDRYPTEQERARWIAILEELGYKITPPNVKRSEALEERKEVFKNKLKKYLPKYGSDILNSFFLYWTQVNDGGSKMLWEKQKAFQIPNRLATWKRNNYNNTSKSVIGVVLHDTQDEEYDKGLW